MSNNDEKDDDQQQQNITDEMEQKRLEEAAASVEWVFCWCAIYFYTCVYAHIPYEMKGLEVEWKMAHIIPFLLLLLYTLCVFYQFHASPKIFC